MKRKEEKEETKKQKRNIRSENIIVGDKIAPWRTPEGFIT
jgi:hypothetical protein